ncbi:insulinase family protein [Pseudomonas sp. LJDD11]|uniref:M16 family metallopeptidase n=2 Tax=Pseudomonadota TaxID=1224 RepID=UPI00211C48AD|nr:insulinase family protein [Pseudomonas sp. LJDD11]MCQ9422266.1 insulinase family protein [Pseudomonas sp. LJDD11]
MKTTIASLCGLLLLGGCARLAVDDQAQTWDPRVVRGQLPNGLEYRLVRETSQPGRIDVRLTVRAGSVDESARQVGVAHLVEHLNFYNHGNATDDIRQRMSQWGWVSGRHYNAVTSYDRTQYLLSPSGGAAQTEQALQALATLSLAADYNAADLDRERPIVIEEWRGGLGVAQRMNDQRTAAQRIGSRYPQHRTIGNEAAIRSASLEQLKAFQQRWYAPNNMILTIVGDIDPAALPARIKHWFGNAASVPLPDRTWRELTLDEQLKIVRLQDSQSGSNQLALLFRLHEPGSRAITHSGARERLVDRLTLAVLVDQLRRQPRDAGVRSLSVQKNQIGEYSSVLGIAAGVEAQGHDNALRQLLSEIERLRRFGLFEADMQREKSRIREIAQGMLRNDPQRSFEQWVNHLNDAAIQDRLVMDKHQIARQYLTMLDTVSLDDLNQRFKRWTDSADRVLQLTAPADQNLPLPGQAEVQALLADVRKSTLQAPQPLPAQTHEVQAALPALPAVGASGKVVEQRRYDAENVEYWQLSNGDRLVWLKQAAADGGMLMQAMSDAGFHTGEIPGWRSQVAAQLGQQQAPQGWSQVQFKRWQREQGIQLTHEQAADHWQVKVSTLEQAKDLPAAERLQAMLHSYHLSQAALVVDEQALQQPREQLMDQATPKRESVRAQQQQTLNALRHAAGHEQVPTVSELEQLSAEQLASDWQRLTQAPVTHYLLAGVDAAVLQLLVEQHLASIPRGAALHSQPFRQRSGRHVKTLDIGIEPRTQWQAYSYREQPWTPEDAARISALQTLAQAVLKQQLRSEATGVYSLTFETSLNPRSQRIETRLNFYTDPARADELWQLARQTLTRLPDNLDRQAVTRLRNALLRDERARRSDAQTQLRRLILSDQQWGDPRYLSQQQQLPEALTHADLKRLAGQLFDERNMVLLRLNPAPAGVAGR